ncbi:MAG: protein-L-isoaspartate(D-aspartate) O-methyltransferase [Gemmatimonadota bacterium]|nr:protein-L-isoaspartate(D-aspartate) O-methyltransferase [Gemmatimonadota bacterium]
MRHQMTDYAALRARMVERDIAGRGIRDPLVLAAMGEVPRERFVPEHLYDDAYVDAPLPIPGAQTISQPYIVAVMIDALGLEGGERVLDVGTGSGYAAAVLSRIAGQVFTIEVHQELAETAGRRFSELGYDNITSRHGDGRLGWPEHAPFDGIVVAAAARDVPEALLRQLRVGGRLVIPVGREGHQDLLCITKSGPDRYDERYMEAVRFVPLV